MPHLTGRQNVALPLLCSGWDWNDALTAVQLHMEVLGILHVAAKRPGEMSGGEQQRVAIARALASPARVILADEPTGALDRDSAEVVFQSLMEASRQAQKSVVLVTHNTDLAARCDRALVCRDGRLQPAHPSKLGGIQ